METSAIANRLRSRINSINENITLSHLDTILGRPVTIKNTRTNDCLYESNNVKWYWKFWKNNWKIACTQECNNPNRFFRILKRDEGYSIYSLTSKDYVCVVGNSPEWDVTVGSPCGKPTIFKITKITNNSYILEANIIQQSQNNLQASSSSSSQDIITKVFLYQEDKKPYLLKANEQGLLEYNADGNNLSQLSYFFMFELPRQPVIRSITSVGNYQVVENLPNLEIQRLKYVNNTDLEQTYNETLEKTETFEVSMTYSGGFSLQCGATFKGQLPFFQAEFQPQVSGSIGGNRNSKLVSSTRITKTLLIKCKPKTTTTVAMNVTRKMVTIPCKIEIEAPCIPKLQQNFNDSESQHNDSEIISYHKYKGILIEGVTIIADSNSIGESDLNIEQ